MCEKKCHTCAFKRNIPGNTHVACGHPLMNEAMKNSTLMLAAMTGRADFSRQFDMQIDEYGFRMGWCSFPINYDPTWLQGSCKAHMTTAEHEQMVAENPKVVEFEARCSEGRIF